MNVTEQTATRKVVTKAYSFERYPMDLYDETGKTRKVKNQEEEEAALAVGFTETPPAIPQSVAVHAMTTQPAIQAGYDALKKELAEKTEVFNAKYAKLQRKYDALQEEHEEVRQNLAAARDQITEMIGAGTRIPDSPGGEADFSSVSNIPTHVPLDMDKFSSATEIPSNPFAQLGNKKAKK